jgi:hypothetical protein
MGVTGVRQAGGIITIVMKAVVTGSIMSQLRRRRDTGITSTGTKALHRVTGMMVLRDIGVMALRGTGVKVHRQGVGNGYQAVNSQI